MLKRSRTIAWDVATETLPDAFDRYIVGMADLYEVSGVSEHDRSHFYNITTTTLSDHGVIGRGRSVRQTLARTPAVLRRSDVDGLNLLINYAPLVGDCDGREVKAAAGAVQFRDLGRPAATRLDRVDVTTALIPRTVAPPALLGPEMHGLVLAPETPEARLITAHLQTLAEQAEQLDDDQLAGMIEGLLLIATRLTGATAPAGGLALEALQGTVRRAAADYIEKRLQVLEGEIEADAVAAAAGVSRATLYRAFDGEGGVGRYIQDRSLHHARTALRRREGKSPTVAEIAGLYGFASASHFSRLFKARFGYSPSDVTPVERPPDLTMDAGPIRHDVLIDWLKTFQTLTT